MQYLACHFHKKYPASHLNASVTLEVSRYCNLTGTLTPQTGAQQCEHHCFGAETGMVVVLLWKITNSLKESYSFIDVSISVLVLPWEQELHLVEQVELEGVTGHRACAVRRRRWRRIWRYRRRWTARISVNTLLNRSYENRRHFKGIFELKPLSAA